MSINKFSNIILYKEFLTINLLNLNKLSDSLIEIRPQSLYKIIKLQNKNVENFLQNFIIFDFYASVSNENSDENDENLDEIFKNFLKEKKFFIITMKEYFNKNKFKNFDINNYIQINKFSLEKIFKKLNNKNIIENYDYISITIFMLSQKEIEKRKKILEKIDKNSIKNFINENSSDFNLISTNNNNNNSIIIHSSSNESEILSNFSEISFFKFKTKKNKKLLNQNLENLNIFINNATKIKNNNFKIKKNFLFESFSDYFNENINTTLNTINNSNEIIKKIIKKKKSNSILISNKKFNNNFNNNFNNFNNNFNNNFHSKHFYSKSDIENKKNNLKSKKFYLIKDVFKKNRIINKNDLENINEAFNNNKINSNNLINVFDVYNKIIYISYSQIKNLMNNLEENLYLKLINNKNVKVYVNKNKIFKIFDENKNSEKFEIEDYLNKKQIIKFNKNIKDKFLLHSPVWKSIRNIYCMKIRKIHKKK